MTKKSGQRKQEYRELYSHLRKERRELLSLAKSNPNIVAIAATIKGKEHNTWGENNCLYVASQIAMRYERIRTGETVRTNTGDYTGPEGAKAWLNDFKCNFTTAYQLHVAGFHPIQTAEPYYILAPHPKYHFSFYKVYDESQVEEG